MDAIEFTRNYSDLSTDRGFQFEFQYDRCGNGYKTTFQAWTMGTVSGALDAASSIFGGVLGQAANLSERARSATWQQARDKALVEAVEQIKPNFVQCPRCSSWVCKKNCWNQARGLCKNCAPDLGVEMAAAQASRTTQEIWEHSQVAEEDRAMLKEENWRAGVRATCLNCNAPLQKDVKFCPECGAAIQANKFCTKCGAKLAPGAKFCAECGTKQE